MKAINPHFFSRTAHTQDNRCRRLRYWSTVDQGWGWERVGDAPDLDFGQVIHEGAYTLWTTGDVEAAVVAAKALSHFSALSEAWAYMAECHIRAYALVVYPRLRQAGWTLLAAEAELPLRVGISPFGRVLYLLVKPDLILVNENLGGMKRYQEFKTTRLLTSTFMENWRHNVQLTGGQLAYREAGVDIDHVQVPFFYKGEQGDGYWRSIYTSAWRRPRRALAAASSCVGASEGHGLPDPDFPYSPAWEYSAKRPTSWKGWERFDVYSSGITPSAWVAILLQVAPNEVIDMMPSTDAMAFDPKMAKDWIDQLSYREGQIADFVVEADRIWEFSPCPVEEFTALLNRVFPQNFEQCVPVVGHVCPAYDLCWNAGMAKNPAAMGLYRRRTPHHEIERQALEKLGK